MTSTPIMLQVMMRKTYQLQKVVKTSKMATKQTVMPPLNFAFHDQLNEIYISKRFFCKSRFSS